MVLFRELVTNRLRLNGIRVKGLPSDSYSSTSPNVPEHTRRNGLFFVLFSIVVIIIFCILFLYCFLVEYRIAKIITKMNEFEMRQIALEEMVERLKTKMENSKYVEHGKLKQPNGVQDIRKRDLELPSEAHNIKVPSGNLYPSLRLDNKLNNTSIVDNAGTGNSDANIPMDIVFPRIRIRRSGGKKKRLFSERQLTKTSLSSDKRDRTAAHLPLIHLENNSTLYREKQSEVGITSFNFWREADWVNKYTKNNFKLDPVTGQVSVKRSGAYLIYAQIVYHDAIGRWSAGIDVNGKVRAKCLESEQLKDIENYTQENHGVYKQCSVSTVVHLLEKQRVSIKCMYGYRTILSQPEFTFWGMVKLA